MISNWIVKMFKYYIKYRDKIMSSLYKCNGILFSYFIIGIICWKVLNVFFSFMSIIFPFMIIMNSCAIFVDYFFYIRLNSKYRIFFPCMIIQQFQRDNVHVDSYAPEMCYNCTYCQINLNKFTINTSEGRINRQIELICDYKGKMFTNTSQNQYTDWKQTYSYFNDDFLDVNI